jgi:hypothetical protein
MKNSELMELAVWLRELGLEVVLIDYETGILQVKPKQIRK